MAAPASVRLAEVSGETVADDKGQSAAATSTGSGVNTGAEADAAGLAAVGPDVDGTLSDGDSGGDVQVQGMAVAALRSFEGVIAGSATLTVPRWLVQVVAERRRARMEAQGGDLADADMDDADVLADSADVYVSVPALAGAEETAAVFERPPGAADVPARPSASSTHAPRSPHTPPSTPRSTGEAGEARARQAAARRRAWTQRRPWRTAPVPAQPQGDPLLPTRLGLERDLESARTAVQNDDQSNSAAIAAQALRERLGTVGFATTEGRAPRPGEAHHLGTESPLQLWHDGVLPEGFDLALLENTRIPEESRVSDKTHAWILMDNGRVVGPGRKLP
jgi:hypothetical protein